MKELNSGCILKERPAGLLTEVMWGERKIVEHDYKVWFKHLKGRLWEEQIGKQEGVVTQEFNFGHVAFAMHIRLSKKR